MRQSFFASVVYFISFSNISFQPRSHTSAEILARRGRNRSRGWYHGLPRDTEEAGHLPLFPIRGLSGAAGASWGYLRLLRHELEIFSPSLCWSNFVHGVLFYESLKFKFSTSINIFPFGYYILCFAYKCFPHPKTNCIVFCLFDGTVYSLLDYLFMVVSHPSVNPRKEGAKSASLPTAPLKQMAACYLRAQWVLSGGKRDVDIVNKKI